jgi:uncharacterized damage-inducible protein DinB
MKHLLFCLLLAATIQANGQQSTPTLRTILLQQFQTTWNKEDWFVPVMQSLQGLSAKQAMWKPSDSSHSVGELAYHLLFWNQRALDKFNGKNPPAFTGDNKETFTAFTEASWAATVQQLDDVMKQWETIIKTTDDAKLQEWYSTITHISTHNAYHTGQILYVRKLQGSWNPDNGVK